MANKWVPIHLPCHFILFLRGENNSVLLWIITLPNYKVCNRHPSASLSNECKPTQKGFSTCERKSKENVWSVFVITFSSRSLPCIDRIVKMTKKKKTKYPKPNSQPLLNSSYCSYSQTASMEAMLRHKMPLEIIGDLTRLKCHRKTSKCHPALHAKSQITFGLLTAAPTAVSEVFLEGSPLYLCLIITW